MRLPAAVRLARRPNFPAVAAALALLAIAPDGARADEPVSFVPAGASGPELRGYFAKPKGAGPFPAVVLLHTCLGLPSNRRETEAALVASGYAALSVDDFTARGLKETCSVDFPEGIADAYGALAWLAARPDIDGSRVAVFGASQGGDTALSIATGRGAGPRGLAFRTAAVFYAPCANQDGAQLKIPTLIVVGRADEVTPAADCEAFAAAQAAGQATLAVIPGAPHGFDDPAFRGGRRVLGMSLGYDPKAAAAARAKLMGFLARELRP